MKRFVAAAYTAASLCAAGAAHADWSVGAGFESFRWEESTAPAVKETGLRWVLDLTWQQSKAPGLSLGYNLKFYTGDVDYTGGTLFGGAPASDDVRYRGLTNEIQAIWRMPQTVDVVLAAGWDRWERKFKGTNQEEDYDILYAKLGANFNSTVQRGVIGGVGVKYPVWTRENAHFDVIGGAVNPRLRPGKDLSFYGTVGYRFNPQWDVIAYYDSYRFKESNLVAVAPVGIFLQPESKMDVFGVKLQHNFQ
ncbi:MAG TPA: hypothetical protein VED01_14605 [Burkholderiales bacterium]|nr:hypothetical protein [Burkholderiales bacterium]